MTTTTDKIKVSTLIAIVASAMLTFMGIVSETALNVAFPILMKEFNVTSATIQWLTTGYLLVVAILVPISPMLVKRYPTKRLFQAAVVIFTVGTIICGFAMSFPMLLLGRLIQAIGTGISLPLMFNLILALIPMHKRGVIMGIAGLVTSFAPAIGPTYGGIVVTSIGWQSIFLILLPLLVIALVAGSLTIQSISTIEKQKIDFLSIGLSIVAFSGIIYGFSLAGETGWLHLGVMGSLGIGAIGLALFSIRQFKIDVPLINLAVFKFPMFTLGLAQVFLLMMIVLGNSFLLPTFSESVFGVNATVAGFMLLPGAAISAILAPIAGKILDNSGPRVVISFGAFLLAVATGLCVLFTNQLTTILMGSLYLLLMIGVAFVYVPSQTNALNQLPQKYNSDGTAIINTLQQVSGAIGTSLVAGLLTASQQKITDSANHLSKEQLMIEGGHNAFLLMFVIAVIGFVLSFGLKKNK